MMQQTEALDLFGRLSPPQKVDVLIGIMFELTIVVRLVFSDYAKDSKITSRLAYNLSELNHRLTSAASSLLKGRATYPDDVLIQMMFEPPPHPELEPYFPFVFEQAVIRVINDRSEPG